MVSTHQQYLCPDFLSPLPATTAVGSAADDSPGASCNASSSSPLLGQSQDSGKSPLALLAQTCNSIGLPDLPSTTNKSDGASQCTTTSGEGRPSPPSADPHHHHHHHQQQQHNHHGRKEVHKVRSSESVDGACSSSPAKCCKSSTSKSTTPVLSRSPAAAKKEKHSTTPTQSLALPTSAMFQHLLPPAPSAVSLSLTNGGGGGGGSGAFALPPNSIVQFPCFGGVSSTTTLVPPPRPCADPFCKTCPAAARACPIGCAQCAGHAPQDFASSVWMNPYLASPFFNAGLHPSVAAAAAAAAAQVGMFANLANALAGSNHHPTVAQFLTPPTNTTAGQQLLQFHQQYHQSSSSSSSYVCNWMTGDQYCGKRFASGDELLQHLRSHATHDALKTAPSNSPASVAVSNATAGAAASSSSSSASALLTRTLCQQQNAAASSYLSSLRFHPYTKILSSAATALPVASPLAPFAYGTPPTMPSTLAGLCPSQRLPGTLQQP